MENGILTERRNCVEPSPISMTFFHRKEGLMNREKHPEFLQGVCNI